MKTITKAAVAASALLTAGAAWAHGDGFAHVHPHPEGVGGEWLLIVALMVAFGSLAIAALYRRK